MKTCNADDNARRLKPYACAPRGRQCVDCVAHDGCSASEVHRPCEAYCLDGRCNEAEAERVAAEEAREALKASARQKLVSGQPLTEEEAALLVL